MNRLIVIFLVIITASIGVPHGSNPGTGRIIGGQSTTIEEHPYQVAIWINYEIPMFTGSGSIISEKYVVTAASRYQQDFNLYRVHVGSTFKSKGLVLEINKIIYHPKYVFNIHDYDVAIMELSSNLIFNEKVQPIALHSIRPNVDVAVVSGWGWISNIGIMPETLQEITVPLVSQEYCRDLYGSQVTDRMICAGKLYEEKSFCYSDEGGPLVAEGKLLGIVSWRVGAYCEESGEVGVYSYVADPELNSFISQYI